MNHGYKQFKGQNGGRLISDITLFSPFLDENP